MIDDMVKGSAPLPAALDALLDIANEADFFGKKLSKPRSVALGDALAERQGGKWAYAGSFELNAAERKQGIVVFTGERILSASARHITGEECCRALLKLPHLSATARAAQQKAAQGLMDAVIAAADAGGHPGTFCCGKCSVSLWRHLAAGGFNQSEKRLEDSMRFLKRRRKGGQWDRMPFFYTLLALTEIQSPAAVRELKYAAPILEQKLQRKPGVSKTAQRRHAVMQRALDLVG